MKNYSFLNCTAIILRKLLQFNNYTESEIEQALKNDSITEELFIELLRTHKYSLMSYALENRHFLTINNVNMNYMIPILFIIYNIRVCQESFYLIHDLLGNTGDNNPYECNIKDSLSDFFSIN